MNLEVMSPLMIVRVSFKKVHEKDKHMAIIVLSENYEEYANVKCVCMWRHRFCYIEITGSKHNASWNFNKTLRYLH